MSLRLALLPLLAVAALAAPSRHAHLHHDRKRANVEDKRAVVVKTAVVYQTVYVQPGDSPSSAPVAQVEAVEAPTSIFTPVEAPTSIFVPSVETPTSVDVPSFDIPTSVAVPSSKTPTPAPSTGNDNSGSGNGKYPFSKVVAFGDNLSDNGNGSVAHGVAQPGEPLNSIYGFNTWTDGPVAVSYLSNSLGLNLLDFAFGHADGGGKWGATIDSSYTESPAGAPDLPAQISNYTGTHGIDSDALHFVWIGANDINLYHVWPTTPNDAEFAQAMSSRMAMNIKTLVDGGAKHIFVPNLYAKHISPSKGFYANTPEKIANLGSIISEANDAIKVALQPYSDNVIYYDVFGKMVDIWNNAGDYGITHTGNEFCDGFSQLLWDLCTTATGKNTFYWMQYLDMTSYVHKLLAQDMLATINAHYGVSS